MTFQEAISHQPQWVQLWLNWLLLAAVVLPLTLFIWKQTRIAAAASLVASIGGGLGTGWLYSQMGFVKMLGLPHIIFWTPLAIYFFLILRSGNLSSWPRWIMTVVLVTIAISLAFDYTDLARYALGNRTATYLPATSG